MKSKVDPPAGGAPDAGRAPERAPETPHPAAAQRVAGPLNLFTPARTNSQPPVVTQQQPFVQQQRPPQMPVAGQQPAQMPVAGQQPPQMPVAGQQPQPPHMPVAGQQPAELPVSGQQPFQMPVSGQQQPPMLSWPVGVPQSFGPPGFIPSTPARPTR